MTRNSLAATGRNGAQSIIIMGQKHSGKTMYGRKLASDLSRPFVDLDDLTLSAYGADMSTTCRDIYLRHGKEAFYDFEARGAAELALLMKKDELIAALGGGTGENVLAMDALGRTRGDRAQIRGSAHFLYLYDSEQRLYRRIMDRGRPAYLPEEGTREAFAELFERRDSLYQGYADLTLHVEEATNEEAYSLLLETARELVHAG